MEPGGNSQAWEAAALYVLELLGRPPAPIDPIHLALQLGLRIAPSSLPTAMLGGDTVYLSPRLSPRTLRGYAAHELGHWAIARLGLPDSEDAADRVGEALMLPIYAFDPEPSGWNVVELQQTHLNCPLETIARRVLATRTACMCIWERGRLVSRELTPDAEDPFGGTTEFESELAKQARRQRSLVRRGPRVLGFIDDEAPSRVITLCDPVELKRAVDALRPLARTTTLSTPLPRTRLAVPR
jgi:hypothetical protein